MSALEQLADTIAAHVAELDEYLDRQLAGDDE